MGEMPTGWAEARIEEIAEYVSRGRSPKYIAESDLPVINQRCIRWEGIDEQHLKFVDPATWHQWTDERFVRTNDILWNSTGTGTIGRAALFSSLGNFQRAVVDSHVTIVRSSKDIDPKYLFYFVKSPYVQDRIEDMQSGSTNQVELNRSEITATSVPIAPHAEQKRIVAKIERLAARTAHARAALARIPALVAKYKTRLLQLATSGELTQDWRTETNADQWSATNVERVAELVFDGPFGSNLKSADYSQSGIRVVRLENIGNLRFIREKETYISDNKFEGLKRHEIFPNDVLFSSFVAEEVRVCLFPSDLPKAINKADCFCIRVNPAVCIPEFLAFRLASPSTYEVLKEEVHGATRPRISLGHLRALKFDLPSLQEQAEIVQRIKTAFAWLERISTDHAGASKLLPKLDAAVLDKAFRGELVPQDPDDESARELLERIKTEKLQQPRRSRERAPRNETVKESIVALDKKLEQVLIDADDWLPAQTAFQRCGIGHGASTEDIERVYGQLRDLDFAGKLEVETVADSSGRKLHDRIRLKAA